MITKLKFKLFAWYSKYKIKIKISSERLLAMVQSLELHDFRHYRRWN